MHDIILFYSKSKENYYTPIEDEPEDTERYKKGYHTVVDNKIKKLLVYNKNKVAEKVKRGELDLGRYKEVVYTRAKKTVMGDVWKIPILNPMSRERRGYPTQKPSDLLERILSSFSQEGDVILDAYCGCGTTMSAAETKKRSWIGIDITFHSISEVLQRLKEEHGKYIEEEIQLDGIPRDLESASLLAHKKDDRLRKEFEKWAILTYTENKAIPNPKFGGDKGIDGVAFFGITAKQSGKVILQVKSGSVHRSDIATLNHDRLREKAEMAVLITLEQATRPMREEAKQVGNYYLSAMGKDYNCIQIVEVKDMLEKNSG